MSKIVRIESFSSDSPEVTINNLLVFPAGEEENDDGIRPSISFYWDSKSEEAIVTFSLTNHFNGSEYEQTMLQVTERFRVRIINE